jgi:hypothetical protein
MKPIDRCTTCGCLTPIAVCKVERGLSLAFRTSEARRPDAGQQRQHQRPAGQEGHQRRLQPCRQRRRDREARGAPHQREVQRRQRRAPLGQEPKAGVDHAGADEQRERQQGAQRTDGQRKRDAAATAGKQQFAVAARQLQHQVQRHHGHEHGQHDHLARQP